MGGLVAQILVRLTFEEYATEAGLTEYRTFAGRPHYIIGSPGWREVADFVLQWISANR